MQPMRRTSNQPIGDWSVDQVISMYGMFLNALAFNQQIGEWDVSNVVNMQALFWSATKFNQPLSLWKVTKVKRMDSMFYFALDFDEKLDWCVATDVDVTNMFNDTKCGPSLAGCGVTQGNCQN